MILGKHVSISGGLDKAPGRAKEIGCNALQVFVKNPRGWRSRKIDDKEIEKFREEMKINKVEKLVVHAIYLVNLATPKDDLRVKSINSLKEEYRRSGNIGADYLVLHPGSHTGSGIENGINRIAQSLNEVLTEINNDTIILLENVAGAGSTIGSNFKEINDIIERIEQKNRIGICLDTCHLLAAGYDITTREGLNSTLAELDRDLGLDRLRVIHINDSKHPLDSNKDEHSHIGDGYIGIAGFKEILNHPELKELPFILETPQFEGEEDRDVKRILELI